MKIEIDSDYLDQWIKVLFPFAKREGTAEEKAAWFAAQEMAVIGINNKVPGYSVNFVDQP